MADEKKKILIIDDEVGFTEMVKLNLEATGRFEVFIENNANRAVDTIMLFRPHLILLDIVMPGTEGPDILFSIRNNHHVKNIPIIFLTATVTKEEVEEQCGFIGGHFFLAKPSDPYELIDCIDRKIDEFESRPS